MHHYLWNWQSAHLERYNQCWKVCTCFRMTHVPIQMTSFSVYQCGFIVKDSKLACSADLLLVENICYIMKWENGTTLFSQKSFWEIFSMFICKFSIFPGFFLNFIKKCTMFHLFIPRPLFLCLSSLSLKTQRSSWDHFTGQRVITQLLHLWEESRRQRPCFEQDHCISRTALFTRHTWHRIACYL